MLYDINKTYEENLTNGPTHSFNPTSHFPKARKSKTILFGFELETPYGIPACPLTNGIGIKQLAKLGFSYFTYKTFRSEKTKAYPKPNISFVDHCDEEAVSTTPEKTNNPLISSITCSIGIGCFDLSFHKKDIAFAKDSLNRHQCLAVSIYGHTSEALKQMSRCALDGGADVIELNVSCPNVPLSCLSPKKTIHLIRTLKNYLGKIPLSIKIGYCEDPQALKKLLTHYANAGANAIASMNSIGITTINPQGEYTYGENRQKSGLSGPAIYSRSLQMLDNVSSIIQNDKLDLELIGIGGASNQADLDFMRKKGATIALTATAAMQNPLLLISHSKQKEASHETA